jgi:hypothetical protein
MLRSDVFEVHGSLQKMSGVLPNRKLTFFPLPVAPRSFKDGGRSTNVSAVFDKVSADSITESSDRSKSRVGSQSCRLMPFFLTTTAASGISSSSPNDKSPVFLLCQPAAKVEA